MTIPVHIVYRDVDAARQELDKTLSELRARVRGATAILRRGLAAQGILAVIEEPKPDLVAMGTHGRKGMSHALLGSVAERVVRLSLAPVLTVGTAPG